MITEINLAKHILGKVPTLTSERLILRGIEPEDIPAIVEISVYDGVFATNEAEAAQIQAKIQADRARCEGINWGICLKETDEVVGICGYYRGFAGNVGEVGYILRAAYRGRGIVTEAVGLVVAFGFDTLALGQIVAYTNPTNLASMAVLHRAGFHQVTSENDYLKFASVRAEL